MLIKKVEYKDIKEWIPIKNIKDNAIYLKNGSSIKLFKVEPINFNLKSEGEQISILEAYKRFLKICNFDIQIIVQTDNIDLEKHIDEIERFKNSKPNLSDMVEDYINLVKDISNTRESISRRFYIVTKNTNNEKIKEGISSCGNIISECSNGEIRKMLQRYFKKYIKVRKELKWV